MKSAWMRPLVLIAVMAFVPNIARAQANPIVDQLAADDDANDSDEVLEESRQRVAAITIREQSSDAETVLEPAVEPVLRHGDPTRANKDGSVWIWGRAGRPRAVLELYRNEVGDWVYVFNWLTGDALRAERDGAKWWTPEAPTVEFRRVEESAPARTANRRSTQLRALARRFGAHEFWDPDNSRYELRLLATPVHRYEDPDDGVIDGAVFAFANGTNPEVLLLLEARNDGEAENWYYGLARLGHAEMHVALDETEIWTLPRVDPSRRTESYWLHYEPAGTR